MTKRSVLNRPHSVGEGTEDSEATLEALDALQESLQIEVFGEPPFYGTRRTDVSPDDPKLVRLLDALLALAIIEPSDPAFFWTRAGALFAVGRHMEAAQDFLAAAERFKQLANTPDQVTDDEGDWAATALFHAAKNLVLSGCTISSEALAKQLSGDDKDEINSLIQGRQTDEN